jgi:hypothetical protein
MTQQQQDAALANFVAGNPNLASISPSSGELVFDAKVLAALFEMPEQEVLQSVKDVDGGLEVHAQQADDDYGFEAVAAALSSQPGSEDEKKLTHAQIVKCYVNLFIPMLESVIDEYGAAAIPLVPSEQKALQHCQSALQAMRKFVADVIIAKDKPENLPKFDGFLLQEGKDVMRLLCERIQQQKHKHNQEDDIDEEVHSDLDLEEPEEL